MHNEPHDAHVKAWDEEAEKFQRKAYDGLESYNNYEKFPRGCEEGMSSIAHEIAGNADVLEGMGKIEEALDIRQRLKEAVEARKGKNG